MGSGKFRGYSKKPLITLLLIIPAIAFPLSIDNDKTAKSSNNLNDYTIQTHSTLRQNSYTKLEIEKAHVSNLKSSAHSLSPNLTGITGPAKDEKSIFNFDLAGRRDSKAAFSGDVTTNTQSNTGNHLATPLSVSSSNSVLLSTTVGKYEVFDLPIEAPTLNPVNKYTDVTLSGTFHGPTETIEIDGFWDGGNVWRVRMTPKEIGHWTFTTSSSHPELVTSGSFECIQSVNKGFIKKNPDYPYTFMYEDGTPWLWKGDTSWRGMTHLVPFEDRWKPYIDLRATQGYNAVQTIFVSYINGDDFWRNEGGHVFELTENGKNYDKLNPGYFQWVDKRITYSLSKGITPVIFFTWAQEYIKFSQTQFDRYINYIVARYAAQNVIWSISGEYNEVYPYSGYDANTWISLGTSLREKDPYDHLITLHPSGNSSCEEFGNYDWLDIIMQQTFQTTDVSHRKFNINWHDDITTDRHFSKPVVNGEYGYAGKIEDNYIRIGAWEIISAGGFFTAGFMTTYAPDKGGWDLDAHQQLQNELLWLFEFMNQTIWWEMSPDDDLTSNGHCLANPGKEYVAYSKNGGPVSIDLAVVSNEIQIEWFNPREGNYYPKESIPGGTTQTLTPPFSGDWVLHIGRGWNKDMVPPAAPTSLRVTNK